MPTLKTPKLQLNTNYWVLYKGEKHACKVEKEGHKFAVVQIAGRKCKTKVPVASLSIAVTPAPTAPITVLKVPQQRLIEEAIIPGKYFLEGVDDHITRIKQIRLNLPPRFVATLPKAYMHEAKIMLTALNTSPLNKG